MRARRLRLVLAMRGEKFTFARTAASPCVRKHGDTLRTSTKKDVHWIIALLFTLVSVAFENTGRNTIDFARTAASPCVRKHGDTLRASTKKEVQWIIALLFTLVSVAFENTKRNLLGKEEERRFGENLRPDVREEEFYSPADNEGEESAGNSVVGFFYQLSLLMSVLCHNNS